MKLRVGGTEVEAKLSEGHAAGDSEAAVVVLQDGRALGKLDAVVEGVELVSATGEELHALSEAGYVLTGSGLNERPLLPWRYGEPVAMDVVRESPRQGLASARDACWVTEAGLRPGSIEESSQLKISEANSLLACGKEVKQTNVATNTREPVETIEE
jgi:hypothetical protein